MAKSMAMNELKREIAAIKRASKRPARNTPFSDVGSHLGSFLGFKDLGRDIGGVIGRILGSGDYKTNFDAVKGNALLGASTPAFGSESTTITHREYVGDIVSSATAGAFDIKTYTINPVNAELFPWLSAIASNYEEYSINGMIFEFKTTSGQSVASTNTSLGTVIMATQYDPTKAAFANKQQMENYFFAQSVVPSQSILHAVECKPGTAPLASLYTEGGTSIDPRFVDFGTFNIATVGMPGTSVNLGELWISYKITLRKPRLTTTSPAAPTTAAVIRGTGCTGALPFGELNDITGTLAVTCDSNNITVSGVQPTSYYSVTMTWNKPTTFVGVDPAYTFTYCNRVNYFWNGASTSFCTTSYGGSGYAMSYNTIVQVNSGFDAFSITAGSAGTVGSNCCIVITELSPYAV